MVLSQEEMEAIKEQMENDGEWKDYPYDEEVVRDMLRVENENI